MPKKHMHELFWISVHLVAVTPAVTTCIGTLQYLRTTARVRFHLSGAVDHDQA